MAGRYQDKRGVQTSDRPVSAAFALSAVLLIVWIYWPALRGGWIWDDDIEVAHNAVIQGGWAALGLIWRGAGSSDYFPLKTTAQWLEWHAWHFSPAGYHLVNLALHATSALLLWRLLRDLAPAGADPRRWSRAAWFGAICFAVHPLVVDSVAWIAELKNALSLPLLLASALAYIRHDADGRRSSYIASLAAFLLALLAKTTVVLFPVILLVFAWWRRGRIRRSDALRTVPFFAASLILGVVTVVFQEHRTMASSLTLGPLPLRLLGAGLEIGFYLAKFVLPARLAPIYPAFGRRAVVAGGALAWLALAFVVVVGWRHRLTWGRHLLLGLAFFALNLLPVVGLVPMAYLQISPVANHFAYLPAVGLAGLTSALVLVATAHWRGRAWAFAAAAIAAFAIASRAQAALYASSRAFWAYAYVHDPGSWTAANNFGVALTDAGAVSRAIPVLQGAVHSDPSNAQSWYNLASALQVAGRNPEAADAFGRALRIEPTLAPAWDNLGICLEQLGRNAGAVACFEHAVAAYQAAFASQSREPGLRENLGLTASRLAAALASAGRLDDAAAAYDEAVRAFPGDADAHVNYAVDLAHLRRWDEALREFEAALRLEPDAPDIRNDLGNLYAMTGRFSEAERQFEAALRLKPDYPEARENLRRVQALERGAGQP